jgi:hypothetical protein
LKYLSVFDGNKITVNKQTRRSDNNEVKITTLKNSSSYRTIQMEEELVREFKKFKLSTKRLKQQLIHIWILPKK